MVHQTIARVFCFISLHFSCISFVYMEFFVVLDYIIIKNHITGLEVKWAMTDRCREKEPVPARVKVRRSTKGFFRSVTTQVDVQIVLLKKSGMTPTLIRLGKAASSRFAMEQWSKRVADAPRVYKGIPIKYNESKLLGVAVEGKPRLGRKCLSLLRSLWVRKSTGQRGSSLVHDRSKTGLRVLPRH